MNAAQPIQKGYALLAMIAIIATSSLVILLGNVRNAAKISELQRQRTTVRALATAKQAIIYKAIFEDNTPGSLLCPDFDTNGNVSGTSKGSCGADLAESPNRLPFKSIGIPVPLDDSGECLWYALSADFRSFIGVEDRSSAKANQHPINPGNVGSLVLHDLPGDSSTSVVALLIAPRESMGYQTRDPLNSSGCRTGTSSSFLEAYDPVKRAYTKAGQIGLSNDVMLSITDEDIMKPLVRLVLGHFSSPNTAAALLEKMTDSPGTLAALRSIDAKSFDEALFGPVSDTELKNNCYKGVVNGYRAPVSWLCFNDWYNHIEFDKAEGTLSVTLNKGKENAYRCMKTLTNNTGGIGPSITCAAQL